MYLHFFIFAVTQIAVSYQLFFFFNDTATTEIYTLSLHDALPIWRNRWRVDTAGAPAVVVSYRLYCRSEEHTSELQSRPHLVCRLLLAKKKKPRATHSADSRYATTSAEATRYTRP